MDNPLEFSPPEKEHSEEEDLKMLRQYDQFRREVKRLELLREEQFRAMKESPAEVIQQIAGAISILTDLIDRYRE